MNIKTLTAVLAITAAPAMAQTPEELRAAYATEGEAILACDAVVARLVVTPSLRLGDVVRQNLERDQFNLGNVRRQFYVQNELGEEVLHYYACRITRLGTVQSMEILNRGQRRIEFFNHEELGVNFEQLWEDREAEREIEAQIGALETPNLFGN